MSSELLKSLGTVRLTFYGVGTVVGAGIYTVIGAAAGLAGNDLWLSFVFAAVAAGLSALSYAELSSTYPNAGAEFVFVKKAFPTKDIPSFLTGWTIAFHSSATIAAVILAFAGYLAIFLQLPKLLVCYGILAALTLLNVSGLKRSSNVNIAMVSVQLLGLALLIGFGLARTGLPSWSFFEIKSLPKTLAASATLFFIFTGFEHMASLGSEVRNPGKSIPRAFLLTMCIATLIYLLVAVTVLSISTPAELSSVDSPLSRAASNLNPWLPVVLAIAALFATANAAFSGLISVSRLLFGMASEGELPSALEKTNSKQVPWVASMVVVVTVSLFLLLGKIGIVAGISSLGALAVFIAINVALIILRFKAPDEARPFRVPISIGKVPVLPVIAIAISAFFALQYEWQVYVAFAGAILVGALLDRFLDSRPKRALSAEQRKELFKH